VRTPIYEAYVAPAFRRALWNQAHARLKAGATQTKTEFLRTLEGDDTCGLTTNMPVNLPQPRRRILLHGWNLSRAGNFTRWVTGRIIQNDLRAPLRAVRGRGA